jgi:CheY-like chemotaxis protein
MVYLVDDDEDDLLIVQEALVHNSYKGPVRTASNGQVFMSNLKNSGRAEHPQVILLDLNMPLKNGFQVLAEIRNDPFLKNIPVVVLTASSSQDDEMKCFELGCNLFYTKPLRFEDYSSIVVMVKKFIPNGTTN